MWIADRVEKLVPYLRRYARASTGDTVIGDACVENVLKVVLARSLDTGVDEEEFSREGLFRLLELELEKEAPDTRSKARRALLLIAVEALPETVAGRILGVDRQRLVELVEMAERDFAESTATCMLIVEDEPLIAAQLKRIAESLGHNVIGLASTAKDAVTLNAQHSPDIVLCDIMLADGSLGTDAVEEMNLPDSVPVVFVTAYPEKYLATTNEGPSYLITKPFDQNYLKAVIGHALINVQGSHTA
ncbi:MAG: response regulator [Pseudomonadota bacterium]